MEPQNIEAEKIVLSCAFKNKYALQKICENLNNNSFFDNKNKIIYNILKELYDTNILVDVVTVSDKLKTRNELDKIGGVDYLLEVVNSSASAANVDYYINIVNEKSILRNLINTCNNIITDAYKDSSLNEQLDSAEMKILNVAKNRKSSEFKTINEVLNSTQLTLEKLSTLGGEVTGVPSGFHDIDAVTTGFHGGEFIIVAARPGMGKTAIILNMLVNVAQVTKKNVALFSLEMPSIQIATRMISSIGQVDGYKLRTGKLEKDWPRVNEAISQLSETYIQIDDTPGISIGEIKSKCRRLAASEKGLSLIVIDYLQLITSTTNYGGNRQQEVADISKSLKTLALELNVPIITCAQLSRAVEGRDDKRPMMSDLRESGSIEQDADIVALLYRDDYYNKEARTDDNNSVVEFIIGKNRSGITKTIELLFKKNTSTFVGYSKNES